MEQKSEKLKYGKSRTILRKFASDSQRTCAVLRFEDRRTSLKMYNNLKAMNKKTLYNVEIILCRNMIILVKP